MQDVTEREKVWLHVDAAYGGSMAVSERYRDVLDGAGRAQSIVINPHKWLFTPFDASLLLFLDGIAEVPGVRLYGRDTPTDRTPTFAVSVRGMHPDAAAAKLGDLGIFMLRELVVDLLPHRLGQLNLVVLVYDPAAKCH